MQRYGVIGIKEGTDMTRGIVRSTGSAAVITTLLLGLAACNAGPAPKSSEPTPPPSTYVDVPPQKPGETLNDILLPGGSPVGNPDPTTRVLEGETTGAAKLFDRLTAGAKEVTPKGFVGKMRQLADGTLVTYVPPHKGDPTPAITVEVRAPVKGVVITRLVFPPGYKRDGGGQM
jgi:hypothetical protein